MSSLSLSSVTVNYGARAILHRVSLDLTAGSVMALIGPNGAGKSTLIRAVSGVIPLAEGTITLDGKDLRHTGTAERARHIAVVPQGRSLPPDITGRQLVLLGRTPHLNWLGQVTQQDEDAVQDAMIHTQTTDLAERQLGELSGGEVQRLLLARALAQAAPILLLDEPTTHLDLSYQLNLLDQVKALTAHPAPGKTARAVLIVLHDLNLVARYADRVALLVDGSLTAIGAPGEVLTADILSAAYNVPLKVYQPPDETFPLILPDVSSGDTLKAN